MIGVIGEILVDMIGENRNGKRTYSCYAGGAPFNLAVAAHKLGSKVLFYGCVGNDAMGRFLLEEVKKQDLDPTYIQVDNDRNTTLALVRHEDNGERSFCFYRKHTADDCLVTPLNPAFDSASILHFGTLMLSSSQGREFLSQAIASAKNRGQVVSMDVNYREDLYASQEEAIRIYKEFLPLGDILKFSEDEVTLFGEDYVSSFPHKIVLITLGKEGSKLLYEGKNYYAPSIEVHPVDTTGAGDAFLGAFLSQYDGKGIRSLKKEEIERMLYFSNVAAAFNTTSFGAIDGLPSLKEVEAKILETGWLHSQE